MKCNTEIPFRIAMLRGQGRVSVTSCGCSVYPAPMAAKQTAEAAVQWNLNMKWQSSNAALQFASLFLVEQTQSKLNANVMGEDR